MKINQIKITDIYQAKNLINEQWPSKIITLLGPAYPHKLDIQSTGPHHLRVVCDDITMDIPKWIAPQKNHIEQILNFSDLFLEEDRLLVHCRGGISRSTSCSIGLLVYKGEKVQDAFALVHRQSPHMDPNQLILKLFEDVLGASYGILDYYEQWAADNEELINKIPKSIEIHNKEILYDRWKQSSNAKKSEAWRR